MGLGSGIRDPGSGKNLFRIPDPGVKEAPDPGSGSATLNLIKNSLITWVSSKIYGFIKPGSSAGGSHPSRKAAGGSAAHRNAATTPSPSCTSTSTAPAAAAAARFDRGLAVLGQIQPEKTRRIM
jgi:hypothetical protein